MRLIADLPLSSIVQGSGPICENALYPLNQPFTYRNHYFRYHYASPNPSGDSQHGSSSNEAIPSPSKQSFWKALKAVVKGRKAETTVQLELAPPGVDSTDVDEVWFAGCHADVGGGSVPDDTKYSLGDVSLAWMLREIMMSQCGILFNQERLMEQGFRISAFADQSNSTGDSNAVQPIYDTLHTPGVRIFWWILELLPTKYNYQDSDGVWHTTWRCV